MKTITAVLIPCLLWPAIGRAGCVLARTDAAYRPMGDGSYAYVLEAPFSETTRAARDEFALLNRFRRRLSRHVDVDPFALLRRQERFFAGNPRERARFEAVLSRQVGRVHKVSCLEGFLFNTHLRRFSAGSEFAAYLLIRSEAPGRIRAVVMSQNELGVGPGPRVERLLQNQFRDGWRLIQHLHNHPFDLNNAYGDIAGTILPSEPDLDTYHRLRGLRSAVITNGFDSLELSRADFEALYKSHLAGF
jgi:hypothetical protein